VNVRLQPGETAPDFTLTTDTGDPVTLSSLQGRKVILFAYPKAMTPGCTKEACDFRDSLTGLQAAGYAVLGISPDEPPALAKFVERDGLTFPLLSDPEHKVLEEYGAWGEKKNYGRTIVGVVRSTFVIDEHGDIELAQYNVKATGHVARLKKQLGLEEQ